ncbi:MAG: DUF3795 domain-containing protein [Treponema sp.]|nr:DUF3795 domain-containing protein [Treponema sp.]
MRTIEEKESFRRLETLDRSAADIPAGVKVMAVCDREGDMYELFAKTTPLILMHSIIAVMILNTAYAARLTPEPPCSLLVGEDEWKLRNKYIEGYCMEIYTRANPDFSLCGLNCALCPNIHIHTNGKFKCPGCGGENFFEKRPSCAIITCGKKHKNIEFCFNCDGYPCKRYLEPNEKDSFITYKNREENIKSASEDLNKHLDELQRKKLVTVHSYWTGFRRLGDGLMPKYADKHSFR